MDLFLTICQYVNSHFLTVLIATALFNTLVNVFKGNLQICHEGTFMRKTFSGKLSTWQTAATKVCWNFVLWTFVKWSFPQQLIAYPFLFWCNNRLRPFASLDTKAEKKSMIARFRKGLVRWSFAILGYGLLVVRVPLPAFLTNIPVWAQTMVLAILITPAILIVPFLFLGMRKPLKSKGTVGRSSFIKGLIRAFNNIPSRRLLAPASMLHSIVEEIIEFPIKHLYSLPTLKRAGRWVG